MLGRDSWIRFSQIISQIRELPVINPRRPSPDYTKVNQARSKHQHLNFCQCCAVLPSQLGSQLSWTTVSELRSFTLSIQWHCFTFLLDPMGPFLEHSFTQPSALLIPWLSKIDCSHSFSSYHEPCARATQPCNFSLTAGYLNYLVSMKSLLFIFLNIKTVFSDHSVFFCDSSFDSRMAYLCKISTVLGIYFKKQVQFFANCFKNEEKKTNSWLVLFYCLLNMLVSDWILQTFRKILSLLSYWTRNLLYVD